MNLDSDNIIKVEATHSFTMFPRPPKILGEDEATYGITKWSVDKIIEGTPRDETGQIVKEWGAIIVKGEFLLPLETGKVYTILAKESIDNKDRLAYEILFIGEIIDLNNVRNQKPFLKTFLTNDQVDELYKTLPNPLAVIAAHDLETLKQVHGIGDYISKCIIERFEEKKDYSEVYIELSDMGLTPKFIQKLIKRYANPKVVIDTVKNNPYKLASDVEGIGFTTADKIALANKFSPTDPKRVEAFIIYFLKELANNQGHSFITAGELAWYIFDQFGGKENILEIYYDDKGVKIGTNVATAINTLKEDSILVVEDGEDKKSARVYLQELYDLELNIATELQRINDAPNQFKFDDWAKQIKTLESKQGWIFTEEQYLGIETALKSQITFITGGSGVGKTSVLSGVLTALGCYDNKYSFAQTALSGKASARMQEITHKEGKTIHRLLEFNPSIGFKKCKAEQLDESIIILDEISMVDGHIFYRLIQAIKTGAKLIVLGDMGQLESMGCLNLAKDFYESDYIHTVELTKTHRQAKKSGIIEYANKIRSGEHFFKKNADAILTVGELEDMVYDLSVERDDNAAKVLNCYKTYWNTDIVESSMDIQVLCPIKNRGDASVFILNNLIQEFVNPYSITNKELQLRYSGNPAQTFIIREGDKIMNIKNNYGDFFDSAGDKVDIFNGWEGYVQNINMDKNTADIFFPIIHRTITIPKYYLERNIVLGYASTVHKYQGSSAKVIIGAIDYSTPPQMLTRELLYTLQTRAEQQCTIVAQTGALYNCISTSGILNKNTFLHELL